MNDPPAQTSSSPPAAEDMASAAAINIFYDAAPRPLTRWQRFLVVVASWVGAALVGVVGPTIRWEVLGQSNEDAVLSTGQRAILAFWHRCIFGALWHYRKRGIAVMTSTHFDGEYIARIIQRWGCLAARGSSSRGGLRALAEMARYLRTGHDVAFTIDGPRGPRFIAKPGPIMLARRTGNEILCFHVSLARAYVFRKSWDLLQIPYPFTRAVLFIAPAIRVPPEASPELVREKHAEMQAALDRLRQLGDGWWSLSEAERARLKSEWR